MAYQRSTGRRYAWGMAAYAAAAICFVVLIWLSFWAWGVDDAISRGLGFIGASLLAPISAALVITGTTLRRQPRPRR